MRATGQRSKETLGPTRPRLQWRSTGSKFSVLYFVTSMTVLSSRRVLGITEGINNPGGIQWELLGTLILAWLVVYLIIYKGLHASGKVKVYGGVNLVKINKLISDSLVHGSVPLLRHHNPPLQSHHSGGGAGRPPALHHSGLEQALGLRVLDRLRHSDLLRLLHWNGGPARTGVLQQVLPQLRQGHRHHLLCQLW